MALPTSPAARASRLTYVRLMLVAALWAGTFVAGRLVSATLSPLPAATGRFALALLALLLLVRWCEGGLPRLTFRQAATTFCLGLTGVLLYNLFFFVALSEMPASRTAIFVAFNPIVVSLLMATLYKERLSKAGWIGIALALSGAIVIISRGYPAGLFLDLYSAVGTGELAMLLAVISWSLYTIIGRRALVDMTPLAATTYAATWGTALLILALLLTGPQDVLHGLTPTSLSAVLYLAIGGTVIPFVWYYRGVAEIGAARTAVFTNLVPVFGVILGIVLLGEQMHLSMPLGGALVIGGVVLTNRSRQTAQPGEPVTPAALR